MLVILAFMLTAAAAAPVTYDQRQDGELNIRADIENVALVILLPSKNHLPTDLLENFLQNVKQSPGVQKRSDIRVMEAFVEPSEPYKVEIGDDRYADGRATEVVIAGRRRSDMEPEAAQLDKDELKLLGATENCGPDRERDPVTLMCRAIEETETSNVSSEPVSAPAQTEEKKEDATPQHTPEVVPVS